MTQEQRTVAHVAHDLGIDSETLRKYVRRTEADEGKRKDLLTSQEREEIKQPGQVPPGRLKEI